MIFLDIETIPGECRPAPADIKAPANYKDPEKIRAFQASAVDDAWRRESLQPLRGRLLSVAFAEDDADPRHFTVGLNVESEREAVAAFKDVALEHFDARRVHPEFCGFNIQDFDIPWLLLRAYKYRLPQLACLLPQDRRAHGLVDLRAIAFGPAYNGRNEGTMDELACFLGLEGKPSWPCPFCSADDACLHCHGSGALVLDGSKVFDLWQAGRLQAVADYAMADVALARELHRRMRQVLRPQEVAA